MIYDLESSYNKESSYKWANMLECFGRDDLFPMWIGDMDFPVPYEVVKSIEENLENPFLGYTFLSNNYYEAISSWMKRRYNWEISEHDILFVPSIVQGISYAVRYLTDVGDEIILQSPVYPYFFSAINTNDRVVLDNPLIVGEHGYEIDFNNLKSIISDKTKMLLLCSPHNPVGRVWDIEELEKIVEICKENGIILISDEVFADLVFKEKRHIPTALLYDKVITFTSPSKTFNFGGVQAANVIISDPILKEKYQEGLSREFVWAPNALVETVVKCAYDKCEDYVEEVVDYIEENIDIAVSYISNNIKNIVTYKPEGTYFLWFDFSKTGLNSNEIDDMLLNKCKIALESGKGYGEYYDKFRRVNVACKRSDLIKFLQSIERVFN